MFRLCMNRSSFIPLRDIALPHKPSGIQSGEALHFFMFMAFLACTVVIILWQFSGASHTSKQSQCIGIVHQLVGCWAKFLMLPVLLWRKLIPALLFSNSSSLLICIEIGRDQDAETTGFYARDCLPHASWSLSTILYLL